MMIVKGQVMLMWSDHGCGEDGADGKHQNSYADDAGCVMVMLVLTMLTTMTMM